MKFNEYKQNMENLAKQEYEYKTALIEEYLKENSGGKVYFFCDVAIHDIYEGDIPIEESIRIQTDDGKEEIFELKDLCEMDERLPKDDRRLAKILSNIQYSQIFDGFNEDIEKRSFYETLAELSENAIESADRTYEAMNIYRRLCEYSDIIPKPETLPLHGYKIPYDHYVIFAEIWDKIKDISEKETPWKNLDKDYILDKTPVFWGDTHNMNPKEYTPDEYMIINKYMNAVYDYVSDVCGIRVNRDKLVKELLDEDGKMIYGIQVIKQSGKKPVIRIVDEYDHYHEMSIDTEQAHNQSINKHFAKADKKTPKIPDENAEIKGKGAQTKNQSMTI